jgi:hypothetical protein
MPEPEDRPDSGLKRMTRALLAAIRRVLGTIAIWALGLILLFEEWGWDRLAAILAWIGHLPGLRWIEARIRVLPPYGALALFALPVLLLLPVKLLALYWLGHGHALLGIGVIIAAKLGGTALTARLFMLTQPTLMRLPWFARHYARWITFKDGILARVKASPAWQRWLGIRSRIETLWRQFRALWPW